MIRYLGPSFFGLVMGLSIGCESKPDIPDGTVPVSGIVTIGGSPTENITVRFIPKGETQGLGGQGKTDATGKYEILNDRGFPGLMPGSYQVTASLRLNPDGSPADPNIPEIESPAVEKLPRQYSNPETSTLQMTVSATGGSYDLKLKKGK